MEKYVRDSYTEQVQILVPLQLKRVQAAVWRPLADGVDRRGCRGGWPGATPTGT